MRNIILTGLPRSGTTLVCHLLNKLPDFVALHEPMRPGELVGQASGTIIAEITRFFADQRAMVAREGRARSKAHRGAVPANPLSDEILDGRRRRLLDGDTIDVTNVSGPGFDLALKHPAFFSACLPFLVDQFECFAIVRNPLSTLLSWQTAGMRVTDGRLPAAEGVDPDLKARLDRQARALDRQILLLDYLFLRYSTWLPGRVLRYEDLVESGGNALALITPAAAKLSEDLRSRNRIGRDQPGAREAAAALLAKPGAYWAHYSPSDVKELLA